MRKIPPMTIEGFFRQVALRVKLERSLHLTIYKETEEDGGGWRADANGACAYGDTIGEAVRAAFDHVTRYPSRRSRLHQPYFTSDREAGNWEKAYRCNYDYRKEDWRPPS